LIGWGGQIGGSSDPRPPSLEKQFVRKHIKFSTMCRFA
jgi:hypothetical protein